MKIFNLNIFSNKSLQEEKSHAVSEAKSSIIEEVKQTVTEEIKKAQVFAVAENNYAYEDIGYRNLTENDNKKGLMGSTRNLQLKIVYSLFKRDGFAKRLIELPIQFLFPTGIPKVKFESKKGLISDSVLEQIPDLIQQFHELNNLDFDKFKRLLIDLRLNGMLIIPAATSSNGEVRTGFIDPLKLFKAVTLDYDVTEVVKLEFQKVGMGTNNSLPDMNVIRKRTVFEPGSDPANMDLMEGEVFFFAVNNVSNEPEGSSDLLGCADELDMRRTYGKNIVLKSKVANCLIRDIELIGMNKDEMEDWAKENPLPNEPGSFVHNEKVKQNLLLPQTGTSTDSENFRMITNSILAMFGFPPNWFADGQDANRAIAIEQGTPIYMTLKTRQEEGNNLLRKFYAYVIHQAILKKEGFNLKKEQLNDLCMEFINTPVDTKNLSGLSTAIKNVTESLVSAVTNNFVTEETATDVFLHTVESIGVDIDFETEKKALEEKRKQKLMNPDPIKVLSPEQQKLLNDKNQIPAK